MSAKCEALIPHRGGYVFYRCDRPAKGTKVAIWGTAKGESIPVCGVHLKSKSLMADKRRADA